MKDERKKIIACPICRLAVFVLIISGCQRIEVNQQTNKAVILPDTGKIEEALRQFSALPPGTKGKAKILEGIRDEAVAMGYNEQACYLSMDLARGQSDRGNLDSALYYYNYAKKFCNAPLFDKTMPAVYLAEFGAFYHSLRSDFLSANTAYYDALKYLKENDLTEHPVSISLNIFLHGTQMKLGHEEQALAYLQEGEAVARKLDDKQGLAAAWAYFGEYYNVKENYPEAIKYYAKAIESEEYIWDPNILTTALMGKADVLIKTGKAGLAIPVLEKSIEIARKEVVIYSEVAATIDLANAYNKLGRFHDAIHTVTPALTARSKEVSTIYAKGHQVLMDAYEGLGDYKSAFMEQQKLQEWQDSIFNTEKSAALQELEFKYQTANLDREMASQELLIQKQKSVIAKRNNVIIILIAGALIVLMLSFLFYLNSLQKRRLAEMEISSLRRQQEIELLKSSMQGEEQERQRLARELHDGIGSMISSAIMHLSLLKKQELTPDRSAGYTEVLQLLQDTGSEVRRTAHNMMPDTIYKQSLYEAVKTYCETITKGSPLKIDVQFYNVTDDFSPNCKLVIYRIIQELVHNIVKHANATHAIVQGVMNENRFLLTIEDNGRGFDPSRVKGGIGLKNVESRVKSLQGDFQIESSEQNGSSINVEFDCKNVKNA